MTAAIKARGESPFPEAGDGVVLRFTNADMKCVEAELDEGWFAAAIEISVTGGRPSMATLDVLVKYGPKKDGVAYEIPEAILDDIPIDDLGMKLMDAVCVSYKGKSLKDFLQETFEQLRKNMEGGDPSLLSPDTTSSTISDGSVSGQGSASKSSGPSRQQRRANSSRKRHAAT